MEPILTDRIERDPNYQILKERRSRFGWMLTLAMLVVYYGFILLIAFRKDLLSVRIGEGVMTWGIPLGLFVIVFTIVITGIYVRRANRPSQAHGCGVADLTGRERDVLGLLAEGLADKEIAQQLGVSPNTVRNHVAALYSKIDVHSRGEAIVWARERGFAGRPAKKPARKP